MSFHVPDHRRIRVGFFASDFTFGNNGHFLIPSVLPGRMLFIIASDGRGWEHVSVQSLQGKRSRTPTWDEMCQVKANFWQAEDAVQQFHPPASRYVNNHPHVLHLWRQVDANPALPPVELVGVLTPADQAEPAGGE